MNDYWMFSGLTITLPSTASLHSFVVWSFESMGLLFYDIFILFTEINFFGSFVCLKKNVYTYLCTILQLSIK